MQRIDRRVPEEVRKKISDSLKAYHQNIPSAEKNATNKKKSEALKKYWLTIPKNMTRQ